MKNSNTDFVVLFNFGTGHLHKFFQVLSVAFGIIAGLMAFLISYVEFVKHYPTKEYPGKLALQSAIAVFFFLLVMVCILGFFLTN